MARSLCKWRRDDVARQLGHISALVAEPKFLCQRCARVANDKSHLCHPVSLVQEKAPSESLTLKPTKNKSTKKWLKKRKKLQKKLDKIEKKLQKTSK